MSLLADPQNVNTISHLIQVSVAPVFLLASVGALLGVFTGRLSRIIDKYEALDAQLTKYTQTENENRQIQRLSRQRALLERRSRNMNLSISLCTLTGILVAFSIVTIFMSAFFVFDGSLFIAILFITGMFSLVMALALFLHEVRLATKFLKRDIVY